VETVKTSRELIRHRGDQVNVGGVREVVVKEKEPEQSTGSLIPQLANVSARTRRVAVPTNRWQREIGANR
jgi:hypothetical protein